MLAPEDVTPDDPPLYTSAGRVGGNVHRALSLVPEAMMQFWDLFEPMYRADQSRSRDTGGTGLGLTIARRILQAHGGDLVAANRPTGGAVFSGSVPLLQGAPFGGEAASQNRIRAGSA